MSNDYEYLGDFSATPPWHSRHMTCDSCRISWTGCWDNFQCPKCGEGELPTQDCPICGEDHEGNAPLACQTGDGA